MNLDEAVAFGAVVVAFHRDREGSVTGAGCAVVGRH